MELLLLFAAVYFAYRLIGLAITIFFVCIKICFFWVPGVWQWDPWAKDREADEDCTIYFW